MPGWIWTRGFLSLVALAVGLCGLPGTVGAQATPLDSLRARYRLPVPSAEESAGLFVVPTGDLGPGLGRALAGDYLNVFVGAAYTRYTRYNRGDHDGQGIVGVGTGDPRRLLGVQADLMLYSTVRSGLFKRMGLNVEVYRYLFSDLLLSAGWENLVTRGTPDTAESRYVSLARWISWAEPEDWFSTVGLSVGVGDGRFVTEENWLQGKTDRLNVFGTLAVQVAWPVTALASWQGDDLYVGASITPVLDMPLVITPGVADVTGRVGGGARFVLTAGYLLRLKIHWGQRGGR